MLKHFIIFSLILHSQINFLWFCFPPLVYFFLCFTSMKRTWISENISKIFIWAYLRTIDWEQSFKKPWNSAPQLWKSEHLYRQRHKQKVHLLCYKFHLGYKQFNDEQSYMKWKEYIGKIKLGHCAPWRQGVWGYGLEIIYFEILWGDFYQAVERTGAVFYNHWSSVLRLQKDRCDYRYGLSL